MILDSVENIAVYQKLSPAFATAMAWLSAHRDGELPAERVELSEDVYVMHKCYETKDEADCHFEAHRDYIDVQFLLHGHEYIGWAPKQTLTEREYLEHKDQYLLEGEGELLPLQPGQFMIFFPEDGHMPCVCRGEKCKVEKLIAKSRVGR